VLASSLFVALIGLTFFNSFFGIGLMQLFPLLARKVLDVGHTGLGLMYSCVGIGSILGLILASVLASYPSKGKMILAGAAVYGSVLVLFSFATTYLTALPVLVMMGFCSQIYMVSVQTALQMEVPDQLRGRVMGIYTMTYNMGPLGAAQAGAIAAAVSPAAAILVGGVCIMSMALYLAATNVEVRNLRSDRALARA
jgi:predicted MFS family arabinose efflux permease